MEELVERASNCADVMGSAAASRKQVLIVTHHDVDGICAGTICLLAARRQGASVRLTFSGHLYHEQISSLVSLRPDLLVLCDMGSDQLPLLQKASIPYLVLDHHATQERDERLLSPYLFGIDGAREISASGLAYLLARALDPDNIDLSTLGLCGAHGDMQAMKGPNEQIAVDAESHGLVKRRKEIRLIGRMDRPMEYSIRYSTSPYIKGLSGNPAAIGSFLSGLGIRSGPDTSISQLDDHMERALLNGIAERMVREEASTHEAEKLFGDTFHICKGALRTIEDLVDDIEACAALKRFSVAFSLLYGDPAAEAEAELLRLMYKEKIFEGVRLFGSAVRMGNLWYVPAEGWSEYSGKLAGIFANAGYSGRDRAVMVLTTEGPHTKVSARANPQLVRRGLDLGKALSVVAERLGGQGGGHDVAAGARFPKQLQGEFVSGVDEEIERQMARSQEEGDE